MKGCRPSSSTPCRFANEAQSQKRALETASLPFVEDQPTVVSSADGAKVQQNSETTKDKEKKTLDYLSISAPIAEARDNQELWKVNYFGSGPRSLLITQT